MPTPKDEQLRCNTRVIDFEMLPCSPYNPDELDMEAVEAFEANFLETKSPQSRHNTEDILYRIGALIKDKLNGDYVFTNAGYLFFALNPRKRFEGAFVRILRYDALHEDCENCADTTFDQAFEGSVPNLIRNLRLFLKDSTFFQTLDESECSLIAVNEALVNAIIHREYAVATPITCTAYTDKLVVKNPGDMLQEVLAEFSLENVLLKSRFRNPRIVEWMRLIKDEHGGPLVNAFGEGTRIMRQEMKNLGLPAPHYETVRDTTVTLYNRFEVG